MDLLFKPDADFDALEDFLEDSDDQKKTPKGHSLDYDTIVLERHNSTVIDVKFDNSGRLLGTLGYDKQMIIWSVEGPITMSQQLTGLLNPPSCFEWTADSLGVYAAGSDGNIFYWDVNGACLQRINHGKTIINDLSLSISGTDRLLSVSDDGNARLWDSRTRKTAFSVKPELGPLTACQWIDDYQFAFGSTDEFIRWFDVRKMEICQQMGFPNNSLTTSLFLGGDRRHMLSMNAVGKVCGWDVQPFCEGQRLLKTFAGARNSNKFHPIKCCLMNGRVASGSCDGHVLLWEWDTMTMLNRLTGHTGPVLAVSINPKMNIIASGGTDGKVWVGAIDTD